MALPIHSLSPGYKLRDIQPNKRDTHLIERKEKEQICNHYQHGLGKYVLCSAPLNRCRDTQKPLGGQKRKGLSVRIRWLGGKVLRTTRNICRSKSLSL